MRPLSATNFLAVDRGQLVSSYHPIRRYGGSANEPEATIRPSSGPRAKLAIAARSRRHFDVERSHIHLQVRRHGLDDAELGWAGGRIGIAQHAHTRFRAGTISLSSSSHLAAMLYSYIMNPVTLPPGRARLST